MTSRVERYRLAPDVTISRIVTGLWQVADMERHGGPLDLDASAAAMQAYCDAGLTSFDMADHYGSAEDIAGRWRQRYAERAGDVQLLTKWVPSAFRGSAAVAPSDVRIAVQRSLDRLHTDKIDLLQYHAWRFDDARWLEHLWALEELRREGCIRHIGLTNFDTAHLRIAVRSGVHVLSNQVCYSLIDHRAQRRMSEFCAAHGISLLAYGTLAGGFVSPRWLNQPAPDWERLPTWSALKYGRFIRSAGGWNVFQGILRAVHTVAERHGVSMPNVACRYVLDQPGVAGVIVGARLGETEHIADNLRVFALTLDAMDRATLADAVAALAPIPGDCGDEYRRPPYLTASGDLSHHVSEFPAPFEVKPNVEGRLVALSGTTWEELAGFGRAIRVGKRIYVSGTTATHREKAIAAGDPIAQTHFVIDKVAAALRSLGARLEDVVRTRLFVRDLTHWEAVARVHGERFADIRPANTLVQSGLVGNEYLVEMEAEAVVAD
ncbi:MAG TPA: aldo/keto reductase [Gemmatimonadaceae bacterium]|nr:aldo/keto reductase [Gemmatimonadaceae bacterium]